MTHSNISWDQLQKQRTSAHSFGSSADLLECIEAVREHHPHAEVRQISPDEWQLWDGLDALSGLHNSHYACWREARHAWDK